MSAPVHFFMGQIEQESSCDESATAFDGGMGLGQFMPQTAKQMHTKYKELQEFDFNPYDPRWNIRAMILYDKELYDNLPCVGWYFAFRAYNGGLGSLKKEIASAHSCNKTEVEKCCKRKIIKLKNGSLLDMCRVNIEYPKLILKRSKKYEPYVHH